VRKPWPVYPFLFVVWLVGHAAWACLDSAPLTDSLRALGVGLALVGVLLGAAGLVTRDRLVAGAAAFSVLVVGLYSGATADHLRRWWPAVRGVWVAVGMAALLGGGTVALWVHARRGGRRGYPLTRAANVLAAAVALVPLLNIGTRVVASPRVAGASVEYEAVAPSHDILPDIYYIVLDGYARSDVLRDIYGYDNEPFLAALRELGFYVADESRSNYTQTALSLAATLNMTYLDDLAATMGPDTDDRGPLGEMIRRSAVREYLEGLGYITVAYSSGYDLTEIRDAHRYIIPPTRGVTLPETLLLWFSVVRGVEPLYDALGQGPTELAYAEHRDRIRGVLELLPQTARMPGPVFVLAHVVCPHPPFVFDAEGNPLTPAHEFSWGDGTHYPGSREDYLAGYPAQVAYLNSVVPGMVREIVESSDRPVVVVLQADHGPGLTLDWASADVSAVGERVAILNALRVPCGEVGLYPGISPLNTFRAVFNACFGAGLPLLEDRSYHATWERPYAFLEVPAGAGG